MTPVYEYVMREGNHRAQHAKRARTPASAGVKRLVPIPPVQETVNTLFGECVDSEEVASTPRDPPPVLPTRPTCALPPGG